MKIVKNRNSRAAASVNGTLLLLSGLILTLGCASTSDSSSKTVYESGRNQVRLVQDPDSSSNAHPATLSPSEIGALLRNVRVWERRNVIHRLFSGEADRTRAFRNEEITLLAPALSTSQFTISPVVAFFTST